MNKWLNEGAWVVMGVKEGDKVGEVSRVWIWRAPVGFR